MMSSGSVSRRSRVAPAGLAGAQRLRHRFLRVAALAHQRLDALRSFNRVQVFTLEVLNQRDFHLRRHIHLADDAGHTVKPRHPRSAPAALTRNDAITPAVHRHHQNGLQKPLFPDGLRQLRDAFLGERPPRLVGIRVNVPNRDFLSAAGCHHVYFRQQRIQAARQSVGLLGHNKSTPLSFPFRRMKR